LLHNPFPRGYFLQNVLTVRLCLGHCIGQAERKERITTVLSQPVSKHLAAEIILDQKTVDPCFVLRVPSLAAKQTDAHVYSSTDGINIDSARWHPTQDQTGQDAGHLAITFPFRPKVTLILDTAGASREQLQDFRLARSLRLWLPHRQRKHLLPYSPRLPCP